MEPGYPGIRSMTRSATAVMRCRQIPTVLRTWKRSFPAPKGAKVLDSPGRLLSAGAFNRSPLTESRQPMTQEASSPQPPLNKKDLQAFIDRHGIDAALLQLHEHTPTVAEAARVLGVETGQIIKSLVFRCGEETVLVVASGLARVDKKKLSAHLGVGRKKVKFASPEQALAITGFVVGSMPPFGHRTRLRTLIDAGAAGGDIVFGGGGGIDVMMRLTAEALLRMTEAEVVDVCEETPASK